MHACPAENWPVTGSQYFAREKSEPGWISSFQSGYKKWPDQTAWLHTEIRFGSFLKGKDADSAFLSHLKWHWVQIVIVREKVISLQH